MLVRAREVIARKCLFSILPALFLLFTGFLAKVDKVRQAFSDKVLTTIGRPGLLSKRNKASY
jgi:hypothetical protein